MRSQWQEEISCSGSREEHNRQRNSQYRSGTSWVHLSKGGAIYLEAGGSEEGGAGRGRSARCGQLSAWDSMDQKREPGLYCAQWEAVGGFKLVMEKGRVCTCVT